MTCDDGSGNLIDGQHPVRLGDFAGNGRTQVMFYLHDACFKSIRAYGPNGFAYGSNGLWPRPPEAAMLPCGAVGAPALGRTTPALTGADSRRWTPRRRKG